MTPKALGAPIAFFHITLGPTKRKKTRQKCFLDVKKHFHVKSVFRPINRQKFTFVVSYLK